MKQLILILIIILLLSACGPANTTPELLADPGSDKCQDAIRVFVWADRNGDGVHDPGEFPLSDVLVMLAPQGDPTSENIQLTTGENGEIHFPARELTDCSPVGYQAVFLKQVAGYQFSTNPLVGLDDFNPDFDTVEFGLVPEGSALKTTPTTPPIEFAGCELINEEEIVVFIDTLILPPERFASVGEEVGSFDGCLYASETYTVFIQHGPSPGIPAQDYFDQILVNADPTLVETLSDFGQQAFWIPDAGISGTLNILYGEQVLSINIIGEFPLLIAEQIADIVLERIP